VMLISLKAGACALCRFHSTSPQLPFVHSSSHTHTHTHTHT
jgi:hypothetical protein